MWFEKFMYYDKKNFIKKARIWRQDIVIHI